MDRGDLLNQLTLAKRQFDSRVKQLAELSEMFAPKQMIDDAIELIREASTRISLLSEELKHGGKANEYEGHMMLKEAEQNIKSDEIDEGQDVLWNRLSDLVLNCVKNHELKPEQVVELALAEARSRGVFLVDVFDDLTTDSDEN